MNGNLLAGDGGDREVMAGWRLEAMDAKAEQGRLTEEEEGP